jgi:hypothetical protein
VDVGAFAADLKTRSDGKAEAYDFAEEAGGGKEVAGVGALRNKSVVTSRLTGA